MNAQKKLNVLLVVLVVILLSIASFVGVFTSQKSDMKDVVPNYVLSADLVGYRQVTLQIKEETEETTENATENKTTENTTSEENKTEEKKEEKKELTAEEKANNYRANADVIRSRFKSLKVENFTVSVDEVTGKMEITVPEDDRTDIILSDICQVGKFKITDKETGEELMNNDDVSSVVIGETSYAGSLTTYMSINFNAKGRGKFSDITAKYQNVLVPAGTPVNTTANSTENKTENSTENTAENTTTAVSTESTYVDKQVVIKLDDTDLLTTDFDTVVSNGQLPLTLGDLSADKDQKNSAKNLAAIMENKPLNDKYEVTGNTYVAAPIENNTAKVIIYIEIAIALFIALILIVKCGYKGILASIINVGFVAILLLVIRLTNVKLSLDGIMAIEAGYILQAIYSFMICGLLKNKDLSTKELKEGATKILKQFVLIVIPILILSVVCCLAEWAAIFSVGMIVFWSIVIALVYNFIITKFLAR